MRALLLITRARWQRGGHLCLGWWSGQFKVELCQISDAFVSPPVCEALPLSLCSSSSDQTELRQSNWLLPLRLTDTEQGINTPINQSLVRSGLGLGFVLYNRTRWTHQCIDNRFSCRTFSVCNLRLKVMSPCCVGSSACPLVQAGRVFKEPASWWSLMVSSLGMSGIWW